LAAHRQQVEGVGDLDRRTSDPRAPTQGWIEAKYLRPAESDINVWNDGPWR